MAILVQCPCGQAFQTHDDNAGGRETCPSCGHEMVVHPPEGPAVGATETSESVKSGSKTIAGLLLELGFFCLEFVAIPAMLIGWLVHRDHPSGEGQAQGSRRAIGGIVLVTLIVLLIGTLFFLTRRTPR